MRSYFFRYLTGALEFSRELSPLLRRRIEVEQISPRHPQQACWWKAELLPGDLLEQPVLMAMGVQAREADVFARNAARLHEHEGEQVLRIFDGDREELG